MVDYVSAPYKSVIDVHFSIYVCVTVQFIGNIAHRSLPCSAPFCSHGTKKTFTATSVQRRLGCPQWLRAELISVQREGPIVMEQYKQLEEKHSGVRQLESR